MSNTSSIYVSNPGRQSGRAKSQISAYQKENSTRNLQRFIGKKNRKHQKAVSQQLIANSQVQYLRINSCNSLLNTYCLVVFWSVYFNLISLSIAQKLNPAMKYSHTNCINTKLIPTNISYQLYLYKACSDKHKLQIVSIQSTFYKI